MQFSTVKSVAVGVSAAAAVIAITGAASGSGVGAVFNLGKTNKVNATSGLAGSTKRSMLSVTNSSTGTALSLQVRKGKAPFSVNSSGQVSKLNASLLGGLAAGSFVQGGGQSRSFGFSMPIGSKDRTRNLLSVPGFGTIVAICGPDSGGLADLSIMTGSHQIDRFDAGFTSATSPGVGSEPMSPNTNFALLNLSVALGATAGWEQNILRYATGSGQSPTEHIATVDIMAEVNQTNPRTCDFDASAIIGPGTTRP